MESVAALRSTARLRWWQSRYQCLQRKLDDSSEIYRNHSIQGIRLDVICQQVKDRLKAQIAGLTPNPKPEAAERLNSQRSGSTADALRTV